MTRKPKDLSIPDLDQHNPAFTMSTLQNAPERHIRAILLALCHKDRKVEREAETMLAHLQAFEQVRIERTNSGQPTSTSTAGVKRKVASMDEDMGGLETAADGGEAAEVCVNCGEAFTSASNSETACLTHPEDAQTEPDEESGFWADHDENHYGKIDTEEMREEYPDGFIWGCCKQTGSDPGCQRTFHKSRHGPTMKTEE